MLEYYVAVLFGDSTRYIINIEKLFLFTNYFKIFVRLLSKVHLVLSNCCRISFAFFCRKEVQNTFGELKVWPNRCHYFTLFPFLHRVWKFCFSQVVMVDAEKHPQFLKYSPSLLSISCRLTALFYFRIFIQSFTALVCNFL